MRQRSLGLLLVLSLVAGACGLWSSGASLGPPGRVDAELVGEEDADLRLEVSFAAVPEADAYLLVLDGDADPIRVEPEDCADNRCRVRLDRLTVAGAASLSVFSVSGDEVSAPGTEVDVPQWPPRTALPAQDGDGPITLVILRQGGDGALEVETEQVEPGVDVDGRIAELEAGQGVVAVDVDRSVVQLGWGRDPDDSVPGHDAGLPTWQEQALHFDEFPESRGEGVTVAVIDDGVDTSHQALVGADIETVELEAQDFHGTAVTAMIVGQPDGRVPGVAPRATVRAYDVAGFPGGIIEAIIFAVNDGADVINVSAVVACPSGDCLDGPWAEAIAYAERHGVVVVAGAGNDGADSPACDVFREPNMEWWPAAAPTTITVGGAVRDGQPWECSPDKDYVDVLAPARGLLVPAADLGSSDYATVSGTSLAAPLVTGLVAVILAERPHLTPAEIRKLLADATGEHGEIVVTELLEALDDIDDLSGIVDDLDAIDIDPDTIDIDADDSARACALLTRELAETIAGVEGLQYVESFADHACEYSTADITGEALGHQQHHKEDPRIAGLDRVVFVQLSRTAGFLQGCSWPIDGCETPSEELPSLYFNGPRLTSNAQFAWFEQDGEPMTTAWVDWMGPDGRLWTLSFADLGDGEGASPLPRKDALIAAAEAINEAETAAHDRGSNG